MSTKSSIAIITLSLLCLSACMSKPAMETAAQQVKMPERLLGLNIFVATDLVMLPEKGVSAQVLPNPRKPTPFDENAASETQEMVYAFAVDLREDIEPVFRQNNVLAFSYISGANYRWDELRKDHRNYSLVIWSTRTSTQGQDVDVKAVLVHEGTGRQVWQHSFTDPYRSKNAVLGGYTRSERLRIVRAMSEKLLAEMKLQGVFSSESVLSGQSSQAGQSERAKI